ncbi:hypothetical protein D3C78_1559230 [compost metagenome]
MFLFAQNTRQGTGFYHRVDIVGGDVVFAHHRQFEQAEDQVRHAVEEPHQRPENHDRETHRVDDPDGDRLWCNHTDALRG